MDFQIILLPRNDYWSWVRASKDYVMAFGPNLTPDPGTAAQYMKPKQVITFPALRGAYHGHPDVERWFQETHPGVRLDPIEADSPRALRKVLRERVREKDRYGLKQKPFYLIWPTDYAVITQPFGVNPQIYSRYGLPGHEGIDIRARRDTPIYCCAPGEVYQVYTHANSHPYGIHVRVRHDYGYKTVYAHLAEPLVGEGEFVEAGQVIGKSDSTGHSNGSHLHLTLKRDGATEREETLYPKDILDPTPFLLMPEGVRTKTLPRPTWPPGKALIGVHGRVGAPLMEEDLQAIAAARLEAVKLHASETRGTIERLREIHPGMFLMARLTGDFSGAALSAAEFCRRVEADTGRLYRLGVRYFELHQQPNVQTYGWGRSWDTGGAFAAWFVEVVRKLQADFPEGKFGFPGLASGGPVSAWQADADVFLDEAEEAVAAADWIGINMHWMERGGIGDFAQDVVDSYRRRFPTKLLFITEFYSPVTGLSTEARAHHYLEVYEKMLDLDGVGAAFAYPLSAAQGHEGIVWRREGVRESELALKIGRRAF